MALVVTTMFAHAIEVPDDEVPILEAQGILQDVLDPLTAARGSVTRSTAETAEAKPGSKETK